MDQEWQETYQTIKSKHDEFLKTLDTAKRYDEFGNSELALINYKLCILLIDEALSTPVALPEDLDNVDETWHIALQLVQKLKRKRAEVLQLITALSPSTSIDNTNEPIERASEHSENSSSKRPRTFMELAEALQNLEYDPNDLSNLPSVLELLFACENVKLYRINVNGEVSTASESSTLRIIRLDQDICQNFEANYFMQIIPSSVAEEIQPDDDALDDDGENIENGVETDDFEIIEDNPTPVKKSRANESPKPNDKSDSSLIYPLFPGVSPCFRTEYGAFIFPDIESDVPGAAFGIRIVSLPADEIVLEILEAILHGVVRQQASDVFPQASPIFPQAGFEESTQLRTRRYASDRISQNIIQGACIISNGLVKGTEQVGKLVSYTTPYIISKLNKAPTNAPPLSNKVTGGVEIAKGVTSAAVGVTGYVANKVGGATMALGRFLAPHVQAKGSTLLSKTMGYSTEEATDKV